MGNFGSSRIRSTKRQLAEKANADSNSHHGKSSLKGKLPFHPTKDFDGQETQVLQKNKNSAPVFLVPKNQKSAKRKRKSKRWKSSNTFRVTPTWLKPGDDKDNVMAISASDISFPMSALPGNERFKMNPRPFGHVKQKLLDITYKAKHDTSMLVYMQTLLLGVVIKANTLPTRLAPYCMCNGEFTVLIDRLPFSYVRRAWDVCLQCPSTVLMQMRIHS
jgi:hypothetical protein